MEVHCGGADAHTSHINIHWLHILGWPRIAFTSSSIQKVHI